MTAAERLSAIQSEIPDGVQLIAVSKYQPIAAIQSLYDAGQRCFAESRAQELIPKITALPSDINWHFIGTLQSNKVKQVVPIVTTIHSVDSLSLLLEIERQAAKIEKPIRCLLEFYIASEESKHGFSLDEGRQLLADERVVQLRWVTIVGVMGMASYTEDTTQVEQEFARLRAIHRQLADEYPRLGSDFCNLSMGMSGDYPIAIRQGSTMVRIGSKLFEAIDT